MTGPVAGPPEPRPDPDSAPFWQALAAHRVTIQECPACAARRFPPMPTCPFCGAEGSTEVEITGRGAVYSWVRVDRALTPAMAGEVPYCIATVDLDGGGRMQGRLEPTEAAQIGTRVRPDFVDHQGWTELRFAPDGSLPGEDVPGGDTR